MATGKAIFLALSGAWITSHGSVLMQSGLDRFTSHRSSTAAMMSAISVQLIQSSPPYRILTR
jgi:hypothetical protein